MDIIHVSGCDLTTKSTICKFLKEKTNYEIKHFDKVKTLEEGKQQYCDFLKYEHNKNYICDRFHDGEWVYAPLYRNYKGNYLNEIENELRKFPYLFVNTYCDIDVIEERLRQREENYVKTEDFKTILDSFYDYTMEQNMPYLRINTNIADSEKYANYILKCFNIIKEIFKENTKNDIYCGNFEAKNLVVISDKIFFDEIKYELINSGVYENCWMSTNNDKKFINKTKKLLPNITNVKKF